MFDAERLLKLCGLPADDSETLLKEEIYDQAVMTHMPHQDSVSVERYFNAPEDADDESKARIDVDVNIGELEIELKETGGAKRGVGFGIEQPTSGVKQHADTLTVTLGKGTRTDHYFGEFEVEELDEAEEIEEDESNGANESLRKAIREEIGKVLKEEEAELQETRLRNSIRREIESMLDRRMLDGMEYAENHSHRWTPGMPGRKLNKSGTGVTMGFMGVGFKNSKVG